MASIHQFIYTKVPKDKSPWGKNGFQTLYYPVELMDRKNVLELESRIHYPGEGYTQLKTSAFFITIKEEKFLVLLYMQPLPEIVDEFGRKGMFLVHGFLIPAELWKTTPFLLDWDGELDEHRAKTFEDIFKLKGVDAGKGNIEPLQFAEEGARAPRQLPELEDWQIRLLEIAYTIAQGRDDKMSLVIQGAPDRVAQLYNTLLAWLPLELREKSGFDPAFDSGKIFFFPLRMFGYSEMLPVTADPIRFDLETKGFSDNAPAGGELPFIRWIMKVGSSTPDAVERAHKLSMFLLAEIGEVSADLEPPEQFGEANETAIRAAFAREGSSFFGADWATFIGENENPQWLLQMLQASLPPSKISAVLEKLILRKSDSPALPWKTELTGPALASDSPILNSLKAIQQNKKLDPDSFSALSVGEQTKFFNLLLASPWKESDWILPLLHAESPVQALFLKAPGLVEVSKSWIRKRIPKPWSSLGEPLEVRLLLSTRLRELDENRVSWVEVVEELLKEGKLEPAEIKDIFEMFEETKTSYSDSALLSGLFSESGKVPQEIYNDADLRKYLVAARVLLHEATSEDLKSDGFTASEIELADELRPKGLKKLFRKLFG